MYFFEPLIGIGLSGFVAFFLNYFYSQYTFKKLNARITLLQTKLSKAGYKPVHCVTRLQTVRLGSKYKNIKAALNIPNL